MILNFANRIAKGRIRFRHADAIQNKSHCCNIEPLERIDCGQELRAGGYARLGNHDGAVDEAREVLRFGRDHQRRGIGKYKASVLRTSFLGYLLQQSS